MEKDNNSKDISELKEQILSTTSNSTDYGNISAIVIAQKKRELESIQNDLNDLMYRLGNFIADSHDFHDSDEPDEETIEVIGNGDGNSENKKDIGTEKAGFVPVDDYYVTDGTNPPEINWDALAPYIQNIVSDLQKLRNLNLMTNSVMSRIRTVTEDLVANAAEASIEAEEGNDEVEDDNVVQSEEYAEHKE